MKKFLQRLLKLLAYTAAGVVILLAIAVGLFRLFLPRLPEYQEDIKGWASAAIGMRVDFSGMDARWGLSGPEVEFYDAELLSLDEGTQIVDADEVSIGVGLMRLLMDRKLVVDRVVVTDTTIEIRQLDNGEWWIQGGPLDELLPAESAGDTDVGEFEIIVEDVELLFRQPGDKTVRVFRVPRMAVRRDDFRLAVDASVDLPGDLGGSLSLHATHLLGESNVIESWDVTVAIDNIDLAGVSTLHTTEAAKFSSGNGSLNLALAYANGAVQNATANVNIRDVRVGDEPGFSIAGRFEFRQDTDGWLVASNRFQLETPGGIWPDSSLSIKTGTDARGKILTADLQASYLKLDDIEVLFPWFSAEQHDRIADYAPEGVVRSLAITVEDLDTESPSFDVAAEFVDVGYTGSGRLPGMRGFSGRLRTDAAGGRLEIDSTGMVVTAPVFLGDVVYLDNAFGTLVWRRSDNRTTILSDSIAIRNDDFDIETNIEVSLAGDGSAPVVDLGATWSITDLARAKRYIPFIPRIPKTSEWFQDGLLAGRVPSGTVRLYGPLDKFPFDAGEGRLIVEANVRDARLKYLPRWPVAEVLDLDLTVENTRLYSERNHVINAGNEVRNARLEIGDFRQPVLTINVDSAGELESLRQLIVQSPLGTDVFGGKLEQIAVTGDGSFSIDLRVPIKDIQNFEFTSRLQTSNASLRLDGFAPPITDLNGVITIQREDISSESLGGTFLGQPVSIELVPAPESLPGYRIVANAAGSTTAAAIIEELGVPLDGRMTGETAYTARLLFPRGKLEMPSPFAIEIDTDLTGLGIDLPAPLHKPEDAAVAVQATIELPAGGDVIVSRGVAQSLMAWDVAFAKDQEHWDFDRGVVTFSGVQGDVIAEMPETRGLHLRGSTDYVRMQDWFDLAKGGGTRTGMGERIRSIDMAITNLHIIGQHLVDHRIQVDRSAWDWLVQIDGADVVGSAIVPYDFQSGRELVIDMERLVLPGDDGVSGEDRAEIDPRSLPPISVKAAEFAFGDRFLGAVEARFRHTADGLQSNNMVARDATFEITGSGGWTVDESDPRGHRSYVRASLTSKNVERTMQRLNYDPGIVADDLKMQLDFNWSGGPREDFMETLDGQVEVRIGTGQLDEVEPGAGRMFGLMSIVALPRRLSLDFRDVFSKGFGFDEISGTFRIEDGETYTCDLSLEGPAADIGIIGRAGLVRRDYDQVAVVSANFGSTLPVVGGVLGGPQVAVVMLVFSQLFKKPLQEVTQIYYGFSGSWDEPVIESATAAEFAEIAAAAGCITVEQ
jgi:uncharacterized protein (TIGR02099 family)